MLDRLVDIRRPRPTTSTAAASEAAYAEAFREAGLDIASLPPAEAARDQGPTGRRSRWPSRRRSTTGRTSGGAIVAIRPVLSRLIEAATSADPDPWRIGLRAALDLARHANAARRPGALADIREVRRARPVSLDLLGTGPVRPEIWRRPRGCFARPQRRHPGDVWVNFDLAQLLEITRPRRRGDPLLHRRPVDAARDVPRTGPCTGAQGETETRPSRCSGTSSGSAPEGLHLGCLGRPAEERGPDRQEAAHRLDEAVAALREAIRLKPDDAMPTRNLGLALKSQGKLDEAVAAYREAIRLKPDYAEAHNNLGVALTDQGKLDEAVAASREAIRLKPDVCRSPSQPRDRPRTRASSTRPSPTREAIRLKPDYAEAHNNLGNALRELRASWTRPSPNIREAIRLKPDYANAHTNLGLTLTARGSSTRRSPNSARRSGSSPTIAIAHDNLGLVLIGSGQRGRGHRRIPRGDPAQARSLPGPPQPRQRSWATGKLDEAIAEYREAIRLEPDLAEAHYQPRQLRSAGSGQVRRGRSPSYRRGDPAPARRRRCPLNLGHTFIVQGKLDEAVAEYREAIRLKADVAEAHCNLGIALERKGSSTRRSPTTARRSGSSPTTPRPTATSAPCLRPSRSSTRPSSNTERRSGSSPTLASPAPS